MLTFSIQQHAGHGDPTDECPTSAVAVMRPLLAAAAVTDLDDQLGWAVVLRDAATATTRLAAAGELPAHLAVAVTDPPVVACRLIGAAWRHVTDAPSRQSAGPDR